MKRLSTLFAGVLATAAVCSAGNATLTQLPASFEKTYTVKASRHNFIAMPAPAKASQAPAREEAATVVGKSYISVYNSVSSSSTDKCNDFFTVDANPDAASANNVILSGLVEGISAPAAYSAATNTFSIPTGAVVDSITIDQSGTLYPVTLYAYDAATDNITNAVVTGSFANGKLSFNYGFYAQITIEGANYYVSFLKDYAAVEANATYSFTLGANTYAVPLLATKTAAGSLSVVGMNAVFGMPYFYSVPMAMDAAIASILSTDPICHRFTTNGQNIKQTFYLFSISAGSLVANPTFNLTTTDGFTSAKAKTTLFLGYDTDGTGRYSGYQLSNLTVKLGYDYAAAPVATDPFADPTTATVNGFTYNLDHSTLKAELTSLTAAAATVIPATVTAYGKTYTVSAIKGGLLNGNRTVKTLTLPASIDTIGQDAFRNMANLNTLYLPAVADWCKVKFANGNANPIYNVFPTSQSKWGKVYFDNAQVTTSLEIPEGVTALQRNFYGFKTLETVTLPSTLVVLGDQAFANCINLQSLTLPEGCTTLGSALFGCSGITELTLPSTFTTISSSSAFYSTGKLAKITCYATVPPTYPAAFIFDDLTAATLYVPASSVEAYKASEGWGKITNIVGLGESAVSEIEATAAPAEYFNLQGTPVAPSALTPGIYIVRKGTTATKVIVK